MAKKDLRVLLFADQLVKRYLSNLAALLAKSTRRIHYLVQGQKIYHRFGEH